jgi:hypothetical protein
MHAMLVPPTTRDRRLFVSLLPKSGSGVIGIYDPFSKPFKLVRTITALQEPWSLALDVAGTLYAVDRTTNAVYTFLKHPKTPNSEFPQQPYGQSVYSVAVGADGTMYVADYLRSSSVTIEVYQKGSQNPSGSLTTTDNVGFIPEPIVGVDTENNVYVVYQNSLGSSGNYVNVTEFPVGSSNGTTISINEALSNWSSQAAFDQSGNLLLGGVPVSPSTYGIGVFPPGQTTPSSVLDNGDPPETFAVVLSNDQRRIYSSDGTGDVAVTSYRKGNLLYVDTNLDPGYPYIRGFAAGP